MKIPLLIFSDAVSAPSGLARIARDLSVRIAEHMSDVFDIATVGNGGSGSSKFPFTQYAWSFNDKWVIHDLPEIWEDFAKGRNGIFFSIQDPSRMLWFSRPNNQTCDNPRIVRYLSRAPFRKWGYFPIDATGPNGKHPFFVGHSMLGFDRILCYSDWAEKITLKTLGISDCEDRDLQSIPHGLDTEVFFPRGRRWRQVFGQIACGAKATIADDELLIGIVATNQIRKDYGLAFEVCSLLAKKRKIRIWVHTDSIERHWNFPLLLSDFGLAGESVDTAPIITTGIVSDDTMAKLYSACDVTLGIGNAEGFGYPIFESLACGTPCIHGNNGGAAEHMPKDLLVEPKGYRMEGTQMNAVRNVYDANDWVTAIENCLGKSYCLPSMLDWKHLWPRWERWFRKGVEKALENQKAEAINA